MKISEKFCKELVDTTIFGEEFIHSEPVHESTSDNRIYQTDTLIFKFSPDVQGLKHEFACRCKLLYDDFFPGAHACVDTSVGDEKRAVLITERLPGTTDIDQFWTQMDKDKQSRFARDCVQALSLMHGIDTQDMKRTCPWKKNIAAVQDDIFANPHIHKDEVSGMLDERLSLHEQLPSGGVVVHNDFRYKNLLHDHGKLIAVLDCQEGFIGPKSIEGDRLHQQWWYAKQENNGAEIKLMEMIISYMKRRDPALFASDWSRYVHLYTRLTFLSQRQLPSYNHQEKQLFFEEFLG